MGKIARKLCKFPCRFSWSSIIQVWKEILFYIFKKFIREEVTLSPSLLSHVHYIVSCRAYLVPCLFSYFTSLVPYVLPCLRCLVPYVLPCLMCLVLYVLSCPMCSPASGASCSVPSCFSCFVPHVPCTQCALVPRTLSYLTCPLYFVPCVFHVPLSSFLFLFSHNSHDFFLFISRS